MILLFLPRRLHTKLKQNRTLLWLLELLLYMLAACAAFAIVFKFAENVSWEEAIWQVWQTVTTVGYGNRPAQTPLGRWGTMLLGVLGIALLGTTISAVFTWREEMRMRRRLGLMPNPAANGYVFFHFPGEAKLVSIIAQLRAAEEEVPICLVSNRIEELPSSVAGLRNVHFVKGSMLNKNTYERANLGQSKAVVVFPRESGVDESDAITKVVLDLAGQFVGPQTRLIHFLVNPDNAWMFEGSRSHAILEHLEVLVLVQECQDRGTASLVQRLLLNTEGVNPETVVPRRVVGWTWQELQYHTLQASRNINMPVSLFALIRGETPDPCPPHDTVIESGDMISIIAHSHLDWDAFEGQLEACRRQPRSGG
jgi:voltage-gated potassium channel